MNFQYSDVSSEMLRCIVIIEYQILTVLYKWHHYLQCILRVEFVLLNYTIKHIKGCSLDSEYCILQIVLGGKSFVDFADHLVSTKLFQ